MQSVLRGNFSGRMRITTLGRAMQAGAETMVQTIEPTELDLAHTSGRRVARNAIVKIAAQAGFTPKMAKNPLKDSHERRV